VAILWSSPNDLDAIVGTGHSVMAKVEPHLPSQSGDPGRVTFGDYCSKPAYGQPHVQRPVQGPH